MEWLGGFFGLLGTVIDFFKGMGKPKVSNEVTQAQALGATQAKLDVTVASDRTEAAIADAEANAPSDKAGVIAALKTDEF